VAEAMGRRWLVLCAVLSCLLWVTIAQAADDLLEPEAAFRFSARAVDPNTVRVHFKVADGYYLYREQFKFAAQPDSVRLGVPVLPAGKVKFDQTFQKNVETYRGELDIDIPVENVGNGFELLVTSQGCADVGVCYPPMQSKARIGLGLASGAGSSFAAAVTQGTSSTPPPAAQSNWSMDGQDEARIGTALSSGSIWLVAAAFFVLGLGLALTPCVYPMLPILSAIIVGQGSAVTRARGLMLAAIYSAGMAVVFTALGVAAGLLGEGLAAYLQKPWVLALFSGLLLALALSMFGLYELQVPSFLQTRLSDASGRLRGGSLLGVFAMGALSALIVGPCVTPPLSAALLYIGQTGDALLGGIALFMLAWGMCVPLLAIGASAGSLLPKAGAWMQGVKHVFGAMLVGAAIWILSPALAPWMQMLAWAVFCLACGVYLRAFDRLPDEASGWRRLGKSIGLLLACAAVLLLVGLASGGRDVWQPLAHWAQAGTTGSKGTAAIAGHPVFQRVKSVADLDAAVKAAGKPVMLDFYADWCVSCKEMERFTFSDPRVQARLGRMLVLQADVTANDQEDQALLKRFKLFGPPAIVFFDASGRELQGRRVIGFQPAERFLQSVEAALGP
jgi:thiol:disulfide interchange protein DsbD